MTHQNQLSCVVFFILIITFFVFYTSCDNGRNTRNHRRNNHRRSKHKRRSKHNSKHNKTRNKSTNGNNHNGNNHNHRELSTIERSSNGEIVSSQPSAYANHDSHVTWDNEYSYGKACDYNRISDLKPTRRIMPPQVVTTFWEDPDDSHGRYMRVGEYGDDIQSNNYSQQVSCSSQGYDIFKSA